MYIRSKVVGGRVYYQAVESFREGGKVRQRTLASLGEQFPAIPLSYVVATEKFIKSHRDVLVRFVRAQVEGLRWAQAHPFSAVPRVIGNQYRTNIHGRNIVPSNAALRDLARPRAEIAVC